MAGRRKSRRARAARKINYQVAEIVAKKAQKSIKTAAAQPAEGMRVFISYGAIPDQVTALRLQTLGVLNMLTVYVPPMHTRQQKTPLLDSEAGRKLNRAEIVLGIVGYGLTEACLQELNTAMELQKSMIVLAHPEFRDLLSHLGSNLVVVNRANPDLDQAMIGIVRYLRTIDVDQGARTDLMAMATLALGLLFLMPLNSESEVKSSS